MPASLPDGSRIEFCVPQPALVAGSEKTQREVAACSGIVRIRRSIRTIGCCPPVFTVFPGIDSQERHGISRGRVFANLDIVDHLTPAQEALTPSQLAHFNRALVKREGLCLETRDKGGEL